jgi:lysophospholipase L1-like esterase
MYRKIKNFCFFIICILLVATVVLCGLLMKDLRNEITAKKETAATTPVATYSAATSALSTMPASSQAETATEDITSLPDDVDTYIADSIFVGDSRTLALATQELLPSYNTFAEDGINHVTYMSRSWSDTLTGAYGDIFQIAAARTPARIYVALGVNGIGFMETDYFLSTYEELITGLQAASPTSTIIIEAILPVSVNYVPYDTDLSNTEIHTMNEALKTMAARLGAVYLSIDSAVSNESGDMNESYNRGDGLHFNEKGCEAIYNYILTHAVSE